jgi:membrane-bound acyltransferase YfiQ involved in biofilm formation
MNRKTERLIYLSIVVITTLVIEIFYIKSIKGLTSKEINHRERVVSILGTPDLAISTEANYIRNRTLSDLFTIYRDDPSLVEYFPSTFIYSHSHILNKDIREK